MLTTIKKTKPAIAISNASPIHPKSKPLQHQLLKKNQLRSDRKQPKKYFHNLPPMIAPPYLQSSK